MKKLARKRLTLCRETLIQLEKKDWQRVLGGGTCDTQHSYRNEAWCTEQVEPSCEQPC